ncbi:hypothetical protein [Prevotella sp. S7 MS 2]|uniref:hypothetical protein n=1 Tax=Prevotella sp. S7 MS 2 TaxID=1287488 RepID=UPI000513E151|nr:hypothetical protein [Prevotella sp. S7 MS 2]KGI60819.1 hypothetical protein HMPREF0671_03900 [Prevotella sp. S7 MS 2]
MIQKRFQDAKSYIVNLTELIWNYIRHRDWFPEGSLLAIQPEIIEVVIELPANCNGCELFDPQLFIRRNALGYAVPNMQAIRQLARRYY